MDNYVTTHSLDEAVGYHKTVDYDKQIPFRRTAAHYRNIRDSNSNTYQVHFDSALTWRVVHGDQTTSDLNDERRPDTSKDTPQKRSFIKETTAATGLCHCPMENLHSLASRRVHTPSLIPRKADGRCTTD